MATGRKEEFDTWIESVFDYLRDQYPNRNLFITTEPLQKTHWGHLWRIFEGTIEQPAKGSKEYLDNRNASFEAAGEVILEAHGQTSNDLDWCDQMDHYMNSRNYD
jgi:hypothetical protein